MDKTSQIVAVVAIIYQDNKFLLTRRSNHLDSAPGYWCPVSGRVEVGETQKEAVVREVKEEVGLEVVVVNKICAFDSHDRRYRLHWWMVEIVSGEASITCDELAEIKWVTVAEMKRLAPIFEEDIQVFEQLEESNGNISKSAFD